MSAWLPISTLVGGYALKTLDDWRKERREDAGLERQRSIELEDERRHRDADFQRETLLELQEVFHQLAVGESNVYAARAAANSEEGIPWSVWEASNEVAAAKRNRMGRITLLSARTKDEALREIMRGLSETVASADQAGDSEAGLAILYDINSRFREVNARVGELLRHVY